ncbi:MAG TPA: recombinase family protein [Candidatus Acidoferrum sp.]
MSKQLKRAAIYARYSTDLQDITSIEDQTADCKERAAREGFKIVAEFSDPERTSATLFNRPGLAQMMAASERREFDAIFAESSERVSRNQADLPWLFQQLQFLDVEFWTVTDGKQDFMKVGLKGMQGEMFLQNLSHTVRRKHRGMARKGLMAGVVPYGYRAVAGKAGEREKNPAEVIVIDRMFDEALAGKSLRQISGGLQKDKVPTRRGAPWSHQNVLKALTNKTYIGILRWGRKRTKLDHRTGSRVRRAAPVEDIVDDIQVPHLRIIDDARWNRVQALLANRRLNEDTGTRPFIARSEHLLAGILRCGACGGPMRARSSTRGVPQVACTNAERLGTCSHARTYDADRIKRDIAKEMRPRLTNPKAIHEMARAYERDFKDREAQHRKERAGLEKQRSQLLLKINRIKAMILDADTDIEGLGLGPELKRLNIECKTIEGRLGQIEREAGRVTLLPNVVTAYCADVDKLAKGIAAVEVSEEYRAAFRNLLAWVDVHPVPKGQTYDLEPQARLGALLGADVLFPADAQNGKSRGTGRSSIATKVIQGPPSSLYSTSISLGRWRAAA